MKKNLTFPFLAVLFAGLLSLSSCTKDDLVVPYNLGDQEFCLTADPQTQHYQTHTVAITKQQISAALSLAGITDLSKVKKAALKAGFKASIAITSSGNLDEIGNIEVYMKETGTSGDGDQIAYSDVIAPGATEVNLLLTGKDMKDVLTKDITLTLKVLNKTALTAKCLNFKEGVIEISVKQ